MTLTITAPPEGEATDDDAPIEKAASDDTIETVTRKFKLVVERINRADVRTEDRIIEIEADNERRVRDYRATAGQLLEELRRRVAAEVRHNGKPVAWGTWVKTHCDVSLETVRQYCQAWNAKNPDLTEQQRLENSKAIEKRMLTDRKTRLRLTNA